MLLIKLLAFAVAMIIISIPASGQCPFVLDSGAILSNRNLPPFIVSLERDRFTTSNNLNAIPHFVERELDCLLRSKIDSLLGVALMANPGERFSETCQLEDSIPFRRLEFLATSGDMLVMSYESGGIAVITHLVLVRFKGEQITDIWVGHCRSGLTSVRSIARYIRRHMNEPEVLNTRRIFM